MSKATTAQEKTFAQVLTSMMDADGGAMKERMAAALLDAAQGGDVKAIRIALEISGEIHREERRIAAEDRAAEMAATAARKEELRKKRKNGTISFDENIELGLDW